MKNEPEFGNFAPVAEAYAGRPPYSKALLDILYHTVLSDHARINFADIGAGTGPIAQSLASRGLSGFAIEPDKTMVEIGKKTNKGISDIKWIVGSGEETKLPNNSVHWACFSGSFHWANNRAALTEVVRILTEGGHLSILYHLMDIQNDPFNIEVENKVRSMQPALKRARPPIVGQMGTYETLLRDHPKFDGCVSLATTENLSLSKDDYVAYWAGSHDMPSQMTRGEWAEILSMIERLYEVRSPEIVRFRSWAWHTKAKL